MGTNEILVLFDVQYCAGCHKKTVFFQRLDLFLLHLVLERVIVKEEWSILPKLYAFTLIELLIAIVIFSLLSALVLPPNFAYQNRRAVSLKSWEIKRSLELARSIAIAKYRRVKACPADKNYACVSQLAKRFLVFEDINADHQWSLDEPIYQDIAIGDFKIKLSAVGRPYIRFKPTGESMESGNVMICNPSKSDFARQVIVFSSGRIRFSIDKDADGYDEKSGIPIDCKNN
jgi:prepilin-type N-terminal cleavage/methylation domain-containing protein